MIDFTLKQDKAGKWFCLPTDPRNRFKVCLIPSSVITKARRDAMERQLNKKTHQYEKVFNEDAYLDTVRDLMIDAIVDYELYNGQEKLKYSKENVKIILDKYGSLKAEEKEDEYGDLKPVYLSAWLFEVATSPDLHQESDEKNSPTT